MKMAPEKWASIRFFKSEEFDSPDAPGSGSQMEEDFIKVLDSIRLIVPFPMRISSGYRTPAHNAKVGGVDSSAHVNGWAADIVVISNQVRSHLIRAASAHGITRIGIGRTFIHLDMDPTLPSNRIWTYYDA